MSSYAEEHDDIPETSLVELLRTKAEPALEEALLELQHAHLEHYLADGLPRARERLSRLLTLTIEALESGSADAMVHYAAEIARERFARGYRLDEVQTSFNILQESLWKQLLALLSRDELTHALGLVVAVIDLAKDTLARTYVQLAAKRRDDRRVPSRPYEGKPMDHRPTRPVTGIDLLHDPLLNKGTAFTKQERSRFGLRGLLPPRVSVQDSQLQRVRQNLDSVDDPLQKYLALMALLDRNEGLFYRLLTDNLAELMPIVYTPTVGRACQQYAHIFRRPRGLYISAEDRGHIVEILHHWPHWDVQCIVVTDGERILGLGDLGAGGMGIPVGKLTLYTACAGIHPSRCLPVVIDVGTENEELLECPIYIGLQQRRLRGDAYDELLEEFYEAVAEVFPEAMIQLEDFANTNAFRLLSRYRNQACTFDDDIQGTGAVALAGVLSSLRIAEKSLQDCRVLFFGAGEAAIGTADLLVQELCEQGMTEAEAREHCWFVDSQGLVVAGRDKLVAHKLPYAHDHAPLRTLHEAIVALRPTALIGASGVGGTFDATVLREMANINQRPIIFALSNPTDNAECTAQQAYEGTDGRAIFASGSPFAPVEFAGRTFVPGQGNNVYIFPGVGLGVIVSGARVVTDKMFQAAARTLASLVTDEELERGQVYPALERIREVSAQIAAAVAEVAFSEGLTRTERPKEELVEVMRASMYDPHY